MEVQPGAEVLESVPSGHAVGWGSPVTCMRGSQVTCVRGDDQLQAGGFGICLEELDEEYKRKRGTYV